jgi:hypothetical protein
MFRAPKRFTDTPVFEAAALTGSSSGAIDPDYDAA